MSVSLRRCPICGRPGIVRRKVDRVYRIARSRRIVRAVDAQVCTSCGEMFFDEAALDHVDRTLGLKRRGRRARAA